MARTLERVTEALGPIEVLQNSPLPQKDFMRRCSRRRPPQLVIGGSIVAGDEAKDPTKLADIIWDLHAKRDRFRVEVATG